MPRPATGSLFQTKTNGTGIRWVEDGANRQRSGFRNRTEARAWFTEHVAPRLRRSGPSPEITLDAFTELFLSRHAATVSDRTIQTLRERLAPARRTFGAWPLRDLEGAADDIARWQATLGGSRYRLTLALRQCLGAAVRWRYITRNPAVDAGRNPEPHSDELRPFTRAEVDALAIELGPVYGPLAIFASESGLRTHEWVASERRDVDRHGRAIIVARRYADGHLTPYPKTGRRRVPLTARALAALDAVPARVDTRLLFPAPGGGHIGLDNWRTREWYPALDAAGIERRGPYALRHSFATQALAAGVSIFQLARVMGTSVKMIDRTYGHLAHDSEDHVRGLLDARGASDSEREASE